MTPLAGTGAQRCHVADIWYGTTPGRRRAVLATLITVTVLPTTGADAIANWG